MAIGRINASLSGVQPGGLAKIVPTSIAVGSGSGSVDANGNVTFSSASSVSLNGCFSSAYDNYRIVFNKLTSPGNAFIYLRMRASGTDNTPANYNSSWWGTRSSNTSFTNGAQNQTFMLAIPCREVAFGGATMDMYSPFLTDVTGMTCQWNGGESGQFNFGGTGGNLYNTTSFDGITFYLSAASTFSGTIRVYGYTN